MWRAIRRSLRSLRHLGYVGGPAKADPRRAAARGAGMPIASCARSCCHDLAHNTITAGAQRPVPDSSLAHTK
jgi:hypothetical protein